LNQQKILYAFYYWFSKIIISKNLHPRILHQFGLFDIRFLFFPVEKPYKFPKLKKKMTWRFNFMTVFNK
jgi:hypothetical protein